MKTTRVLLTLTLALAGAGAMRAFDPAKGVAQTEVTFFEPKNFTDVRDSAMDSSDSFRDATLAELKTYLVRQANRYLTPGQKLTITVTDVHLAGDFEPWRGPRWDDVRIVKDIYPPRIALSFQLTDADGQIVREGKRELTDLAFMMKMTMAFQDDPLRHEKALLDDWLSEEFRTLKKH